MASTGMGGVDFAAGFALYFGEDQPGEFADRETARLVRRLVPWLHGEDLQIQHERRELERQAAGR